LFEFTLPDFYPFISLIFWKLISSRLFYISIDYLFCYGGFSLNVQLYPILRFWTKTPYFIVETKSTLFTDALRPTEKAKIACGKEHFKALGKEVEFAVTNAFEDFSGKYV